MADWGQPQSVPYVHFPNVYVIIKDFTNIRRIININEVNILWDDTDAAGHSFTKDET